MIATGQFLDMIERLEKRSTACRTKMAESCFVKTMHEQYDSFYDGYEQALRDMFDELEKEI